MTTSAASGYAAAQVLSIAPDTALTSSTRAKALVVAGQASRSLLDYVERVARSEAPILIHGETGTGKELIARHVHQCSGRSGRFVAVNCGAISETLADSELFGHEAGAFTGAVGRREGWFEAANGGTLFLDELGDLPWPLQVKLLRVLQEGEVIKLGSRRATPVDVRLVAATNKDLGEAVRAGHFRLDLFFRLNVAPVRLSPLRERREDILPLAEHFLDSYSQRLGLPRPRLAEDARALLQRHSWHGNIRELENVIHHALLVVSDRDIRALDLNVIGVGSSASVEYSDPKAELEASMQRLLASPCDERFLYVERLLINSAYAYTGYHQVRTAELLGISRNVLRTLLRKHELLGVAERSATQAISA